MKKVIKILFNIAYVIGAACVLVLLVFLFFGTLIIPFDYEKQMVSVNLSAWLIILFGTLPMNLVCFAVYYMNELDKSSHKKRNFILVFIPGCICFIASMVLIIPWIYSFIKP